MEAAEGSSTGVRVAGIASAQRGDDGRQVRRGGPAAPADDGDAELGHEAVQVLRQVVGREVVVHRPSTTDGRPAFGTQAMGTRLAPER